MQRTKNFRDRVKKIDFLAGNTPHDFRHTFSKLCTDFDVEPDIRAVLLGHSFNDISRKVYFHADLEKLRSEIEKIKL